MADPLYGIEKIGGASRARTDGLVVANDALSQLSYSPAKRLMIVLPTYFTSVSFPGTTVRTDSVAESATVTRVETTEQRALTNAPMARLT